MCINRKRSSCYITLYFVLLIFSNNLFAAQNKYYFNTGLSYNHLGTSNPNTTSYKGWGNYFGFGRSVFSKDKFVVKVEAGYSNLRLYYPYDKVLFNAYGLQTELDYKLQGIHIGPIIGYSKLFYQNQSNSAMVLGLAINFFVNDLLSVGLLHKRYYLENHIAVNTGPTNQIAQNELLFIFSI